MFFQHPKRDSAIIALVFCAVLTVVFLVPSAIRFVKAQNTHAIKGVVDVQLSPDERSSLEKEIVSIHNAIQRGDQGGERALAQQYIELGGLYEKLGYLLKAKDAYTKSVQQDGRSADGYLRLASILVRMEDRIGAKKAFEDALSAEPYSWKAYDAYAQFYTITLRNPEEARGMYLKGLVATANNTNLMRAYVAFLESIGALSEAQEYQKEILKRESNK